MDLLWRPAVRPETPSRHGDGRTLNRGFYRLFQGSQGLLRLRGCLQRRSKKLTTVWQAYRFALDPNDRQRGRLASHAGGARYAYNLGLQWLKTSLEDRRKGGDVTVPGAFQMHQRWNEWKKDPTNGISWWSDNS